MEADEWNQDIDIRKPSPARMYDYFLGGSHNFAADREAAEQVIAAIPNARDIAHANRAFLRNVVLHLVEQGIRQFLDIGSGIPTVGNIHELVHGHTQTANVVYVDTDPVAVAHSIELLKDNDHATAIRADLRHPDAILSHHAVRTMLDLKQPVALLMVSMLHFVPNPDAHSAVEHLRNAIAPGSYLALSHTTTEALETDRSDAIAEIYRRSTSPGGAIRDRASILRFFDGMTLQPPGLVWVSQWSPGTAIETTGNPQDTTILAGLARKP